MCKRPTRIGEQTFRCGCCLFCRMAKATEWKNRLEIEMKHQDSAVFVTLTYADEHLPIDENGVAYGPKKHIQEWMDRVRHKNKYKGRPNPRYYIVCEEGPEWSRPHYHGIIFGVLKEHREQVLKWTKGYSYFRDCNEKAIAYVVDYMMKKKDSEWALMSKRPMIGHQYLEGSKDYHALTLENEMRTKRKAMLPKSWYNHLGVDQDDVDRMKKERLKRYAEFKYKQGKELMAKGDPTGEKMRDGIEFQKSQYLNQRKEL